MTPSDLGDAFWAKVDRRAPDECWEWQGARLNGYGRAFRSGLVPGKHSFAAHRFAYEALVGPIPEGLTLDHLCRNRACINPAHLEPVTFRENVLRGESPAAVNARKTHCNRGHKLDEPNTAEYFEPDGRWRRRRCRQCERDRMRASDQRLRAIRQSELQREAS